MISDRASEIFLEARTLDPQTRAEYLRVACNDDQELREEVDSLLVASSESEAYFDSLAGKIGLAAIAEDDDAPLPEGVPDRLLEAIRKARDEG